MLSLFPEFLSVFIDKHLLKNKNLLQTDIAIHKNCSTTKKNNTNKSGKKSGGGGRINSFLVFSPFSVPGCVGARENLFKIN